MIALLVLELDLDKDGTLAGLQTVEALRSIDPPNVPHFAGSVRVVVDAEARYVLAYLDADV